MIMCKQTFYYIDWPEAQKVMQLDPMREHSYIIDEGFFVESEWWDRVTDS